MWDECAIPVGGKTASTAFCVVVLVNTPCTVEIRKTNTFPVSSLVSAEWAWTKKGQCMIVMYVVFLSLMTE